MSLCLVRSSNSCWASFVKMRLPSRSLPSHAHILRCDHCVRLFAMRVCEWLDLMNTTRYCHILTFTENKFVLCHYRLPFGVFSLLTLECFVFTGEMSDANRPIEYLKIVGAVILPNVGGYFSSKITRANITPWYESLKRPSWNPPNYVFAPVWISIYSSIGYASYLVYRDCAAKSIGWNSQAKIAAGLYASQMILNWAWTPLFFKYHQLKWVSDNNNK